MALNNQIIGSIAANLVANNDGNITGANFANVTSNLQTFISNNGSAVKSVGIQSSTSAGFTANYTLTLPVNDGDSGQYLQTDGSGVLSWATVSTESASISNGNSNVSIPAANGNVNISAVGNANVLVVTGTGANVTGTFRATGNINAPNVIGGNLLTSGFASVTGNIDAGANINLDAGATRGILNGNTSISIAPNANITFRSTSNATMVITDTGANITGTGNFSGNLSAANLIGSHANGNSNINIPTANGNVNISAVGNANVLVVTGTGANITGTLNVTANANVDNLGTATAIISTGNITTVNTGLVQNGNSNIAITSNANITLTAKSNATVVISDTGANITGTGNFSGNVNAANLIGPLANGNSNINIPTANGNVNISAVGNADVLVVTGTGANITGTGNFSGNVNAANLIGPLANGNSNINIPAANGNVTISAVGNANVLVVTGTGANIAGTLSANGNINFTGANVFLGAVGNVEITGGSLGQVLTTDGGSPPVLSWTTVSGGGGGASISNGTSNVNIATADGNLTIGISGTANVLTANSSNVILGNAVGFILASNNGTAIRQVQLRSTTNAGFTANYSLILPANVGTSGQYLQTDGNNPANLSWQTVSGGGGGASISNGTSNVDIAASGGNVTVGVGGTAAVATFTTTGANVTGTANITGSVIGGNIITTGQITSNRAGNQSTGAGQFFVAGTNPRIDFSLSGLGTPTFTTRSTGQKITLYPSLTGSEVDYAMGVAAGTFWQSIDQASSSFDWFAGTTEIANLTGTGLFTVGNISSPNIVGNFTTTTGGNIIAIANNGSANRQITLRAPTVAGFSANYTLLLPPNVGTSGQVLTSDGNNPANLSWTTVSGGGGGASISNGTSNVNIASSGGSVTVGVGGVAAVATFASTGLSTIKLTATGAGNLSDGGGQLYLNGGGNNRIDFNNLGAGLPTFTTRSAGQKITLFPSLTGTETDYGIGIASSTFWLGLDRTSSAFRYYAGTTEIANLTGAGAFTTLGPHQGTFFTGANLNNGTSNITIGASGGNVSIAVASSNVLNMSSTVVGLLGTASIVPTTANTSNLGNATTFYNSAFVGNLGSSFIDGGNLVGFRNVPINTQAGAYGPVLTDSGKAIYKASGTAAATVTIPANSNIAYPLGTVLTFLNLSANAMTIAITTDTMILSNAGTTGSRTLAANGVASAIKYATTAWIISGTGLT